MRTYIIRFHDQVKGSCFAEVVAGSHMDAESDFSTRYATRRIISIHEKQFRYNLSR